MSASPMSITLSCSPLMFGVFISLLSISAAPQRTHSAQAALELHQQGLYWDKAVGRTALSAYDRQTVSVMHFLCIWVR